MVLNFATAGRHLTRGIEELFQTACHSLGDVDREERIAPRRETELGKVILHPLASLGDATLGGGTQKTLEYRPHGC